MLARQHVHPLEERHGGVELLQAAQRLHVEHAEGAVARMAFKVLLRRVGRRVPRLLVDVRPRKVAADAPPVLERGRAAEIRAARRALAAQGAEMEQDGVVRILAGREQGVHLVVRPALRRALHGEQIAELPGGAGLRCPCERGARGAAEREREADGESGRPLERARSRLVIAGAPLEVGAAHLREDVLRREAVQLARLVEEAGVLVPVGEVEVGLLRELVAHVEREAIHVGVAQQLLLEARAVEERHHLARKTQDAAGGLSVTPPACGDDAHEPGIKVETAGLSGLLGVVARRRPVALPQRALREQHIGGRAVERRVGREEKPFARVVVRPLRMRREAVEVVRLGVVGVHRERAGAEGTHLGIVAAARGEAGERGEGRSEVRLLREALAE